MNRLDPLFRSGVILSGLAYASLSWGAGFNSGSTGADGDFAPAANIALQMPDSGVFNFGTVNIPSGVKVSFVKNAANTPVIILATGKVTIAGTLDISGGSSVATGSGTFGTWGQGGFGGPGGYDGGRGGQAGGNRWGGTGMGPGGGLGGNVTAGCYAYNQGGGGGGFGTGGQGSFCVTAVSGSNPGVGGPTYGSASVLPLIGGSGGGGGAGGEAASGTPGTGGGGGGGALLIAASGGVELTGSIQAFGGASGKPGNCDYNYKPLGGAGGGGSGGAVRILAPTFSGAGGINIGGGSGRPCTGGTYSAYLDGGNGGVGRTSIETVTSGTLRLTGLPVLAISSVGGVEVPPNPVGLGDVVLPTDLPNPVTINLSASSIPVGTVVKLVLSVPYGVNVTANSTPLAGALAASTATATINIPMGASILNATATYTLTLAQGEALSVYAAGERVEKVELATTLGGGSTAVLITVSGKRHEVPAAVLAVAMG